MAPITTQLSCMQTSAGCSHVRLSAKHAVGNSKLVAPAPHSGSRRDASFCVSNIGASSGQDKQPNTKLRALHAGAAALSAAVLLAGAPVHAELNKYEASTSGEFNVGSAGQYGATKIDKQDFTNQDFRRANFTSTSMKGTDFSGSNCRGAYFIKAMAANAKFVGTDLSDILFDRAVLVEADLTDAILTRTIFTSSDFLDAIIDGADFTDALVDKGQQQAMCKYAKGTNSITGVSTRKSLGCGRGRSGTPSTYMTDDRSEKPAPAFSPDDFNAGNKRRPQAPLE